MSLRTLFVDDDPRLLRSLANELIDFPEMVQPAFAQSGAAALAMLEREEFEAVVADMRMPEMDGVALLVEVERRHPSVARVVLSGNPEYEGTLRKLPMAHHFMVKPVDVSDVVDVVRRTVTIARRLRHEHIIRLTNSIGTPPPAPRISARLEALFADPDAPLTRAADIISTDPSLVTRTIHLVNSATLNLRRSIVTVSDAVLYLGRERLRQTVLAAEAFGSSPPPPPDVFDLDGFQRQSFVVAALAKRLAAPQSAEVAFLGGLLHGIGRLTLASRMPDAYRDSCDVRRLDKLPRHLAERVTCGATGADLGAVLLDRWCFPFPVLECVAEHDAPIGRIRDRPASPVLAVQLASQIVDAIVQGDSATIDALCAKGANREAKKTIKALAEDAASLLEG